MPADVCLVLPTYNEVANVPVLIPRIFEVGKHTPSYTLHVLIVDDESTDGTAQVVEGLRSRFERLHLISGKKRGLGEAYKRGFAWAIERLKPEFVFQMDADLQHDCALIPRFLEVARSGSDVVIGSRLMEGGSTPNFSFYRRALSVGGNWLLRKITGLSDIRDFTSGYRCIRASILPGCDLSALSTRGYSFQSSLLFELVRNGAKVTEIPIIFPDRIHGKSKLSFRDKAEFIVNVGRMWLRR